LLDYDQEVFYGERYRGNYLERLEEQAKQCYDEPTFLATLHLMFSLIAQQASLYYNLLTRPSFDLDDPIPQQVPIANDINSNGNKEKATRINPASYATIHGDIRLQDEGQQQHRSNNQHIFRRRKSLSSLRNSRQQQQQEIATFLTTDDSSTVTQQRSAPPSITRRTVMDLFGYSDFATTKPTSGTLLMQADATDSLQRRRDRTQSNTMADTAPRQRKQESSERRPRLLSSPLILFSTNDDNTVADYDGVDGGKWAEYQRKIWAILQCYGSDQEIVKHFAETVGRQQHPQSQQQPMEEGDAVLVVT
jgi:hypothetical protein